MTMPYLMNCNHIGEGWCLDCVKRQHDESERLLAELERLQKAMAGDPTITKFTYTPEDGVECEMTHWAVRLITNSVLDSLLADREIADANFFTMTFHHPEAGPLEVTIRRTNGRKTPAETIAELRAELAAVKADRDGLLMMIGDHADARTQYARICDEPPPEPDTFEHCHRFAEAMANADAMRNVLCLEAKKRADDITAARLAKEGPTDAAE